MAADTATALGSAMAQDLMQIKASAQSLAGATAPIAEAANAAGAPAQGFSGRMAELLHQVNQQDRQADEKMAAVDTGASDDLVGAMLASQEAGLSFSMLMQVRNKVMGAVEELVKLPL